MKTTKIGGIGNYYGGLHVCELNGKYYWIIEDYDTDFDDITEWDEIKKEVYDYIVKNQAVEDNNDDKDESNNRGAFPTNIHLK